MRGVQGSPARSSVWRDRILSHLGSREVAHVIYGATVGLALVLALEDHPPSAWHSAGLVVATALAIGLADLYAEAVSAEARTRRSLGRGQIAELAEEASWVVFGAGFPAVLLVVAAIGLLSVHHAFTLSKWIGLTLICGYGYLAGRMAGAKFWPALWHALVIGLIGIALIGAKSALH
jgi:hypothetical protein